MRIGGYGDYTSSSVRLNKGTGQTAGDELSRLSVKFKGYSFFAADIRPGMIYGSKNTTNVAISPQFLKKMADDPELEAEYEKEIENMKRLDEQNVRTHEMNGGKLIAQGWAIDKDGGISKWSIGNPGGNIRVKSPTEYANELYEKKKADKNDYLKSFRDKYRRLSISTGYGMDYNKDRKTGSVAVNDRFLNKAITDPEAEKKLSELMFGIDKAEKTVAAYYNSLGGVTERTSHWYIDENGNCTNFSYIRRDDKLNQKLREEAAKDTQERMERSIEKSRERADELRSDRVEFSAEGLAANAEEHQQEEKDVEDEETAEEDEEIESESVGKSMGINAAKLARMLAAAKTRSQVQAVMDMIQSDLRECDAGKEQGYDVDEATVSAAENLLQEAKSRMSSAEDREPTPQEEMMSALASLM